MRVLAALAIGGGTFLRTGIRAGGLMRWVELIGLLAALGCSRTPLEEFRAGMIALGPACDDTQAYCVQVDGHQCVDLQTHPQHCGACGLACDNGESCVQGQCQVVAVCQLVSKTKVVEHLPIDQAVVDAGDFNADGYLDLVVSPHLPDQPTPIAIMFGQGAGKFIAPLNTGLSSYTSGNNWGRAADLNRDGVLDLVLSAVGAGVGLNVALGRGDGTFASKFDPTRERFAREIAEVFPGLVTDMQGPFVADVDNDGAFDVVVQIGASRLVFWGRGDGTFSDYTTAGGKPWPPSSPYESDEWALVAVGDVNGDQRPDLVLSRAFSGGTLADGAGNVGTELQKPGGSFGTRIDYQIQGEVTEVKLVDVDANGRLDVIVGSGAQSSQFPGDPDFAPGSWVSVLLQGAAGFLTVAGEYHIKSGAVPLTYVNAGDANGDNWPDLVAVTDGSISVFAAEGSGSFDTTPQTSTGPVGVPLPFVLGDFDGDGSAELISQATPTPSLGSGTYLETSCR